MAITYQWYLNDVIIDGATDSTIVIDPITADDFGTYMVEVTSDGNTVAFIAGYLSMDTGTVELISDFKIITPLSKIDRASRQCDPYTINAMPGKWGKLMPDGSVENFADHITGYFCSVMFGTRSSVNRYEASDVKVGRITTFESIGYRYTVGLTGYDGNLDLGDFCIISKNTASLGKLVSIAYTGETGIFDVVARVEGIAGDQVTFRTISPVSITIGGM